MTRENWKRILILWNLWMVKLSKSKREPTNVETKYIFNILLCASLHNTPYRIHVIYSPFIVHNQGFVFPSIYGMNISISSSAFFGYVLQTFMYGIFIISRYYSSIGRKLW